MNVNVLLVITCTIEIYNVAWYNELNTKYKIGVKGFEKEW